jgi:hypothetical protein
MTRPNVEKITFTLLGMAREMQPRVLIDALNQAFVRRPDISADLLIPWTENLLTEIRERLTELEQTEGHACP